MLRILETTSPDIANGIGIRVTVWVAGCKHHCNGCHNKWTWKYDQGEEVGMHFFEDLRKRLSLPYVKGLTFSGGDPLCQDKEGLRTLKTIIEWMRSEFPEKDVWLYTGYTMDELGADREKMLIVSMCDYIVEGRFEIEKKDPTLAFRGSSNQRIIDMNATKKACKLVTVDF